MLVSAAEDANGEYRPNMEDGHTVLDPIPLHGAGLADEWGFFAVYDGHGGAQEMEFCEASLHDFVAEELHDTSCVDRHVVSDAFAAAFKKVDAELLKLGSFKSGCTATVALVRRLPNVGVELHVGNVGDSRALLVGSFGTRRLSIDHRTCDCSELMRIKHAGGFVYNRRVGGTLSVTRALGDHYLKPSVSCDPDVCSYTHSSTDEIVALVIASDGLWDAVEDDEVEEVFMQHLRNAVVVGSKAEAASRTAVAASKLQEGVAKDLVRQAKARGSRDNITVLVVVF